MNSENLPAVGAPVEPTVMPALGYKHHAERVRNTGLHMEATAAFIEAQNAEIEYLYAALQRVRNRVGGSQRNKCEQCGHSFTGKPEAEAAGGKVPEDWENVWVPRLHTGRCDACGRPTTKPCDFDPPTMCTNRMQADTAVSVPKCVARELERLRAEILRLNAEPPKPRTLRQRFRAWRERTGFLMDGLDGGM